MLALPPSVSIYLSLESVDFRKGVNGLLGIVRQLLERDPFGGHLFVFVNKRRDKVKILFWDRGGFVLYYKQLERGRFKLPRIEGQREYVLSSSDLSMLLEGIDFAVVKRPRLWEPHRQLAAGW